MAIPVAAAWWIAPALTTLLLALPAFALWRMEKLDRRRAAAARAGSGAGQDEPGAGEGPVNPTRQVPPAEHEPWAEFERQFAEYVERSSRPDGPDRTRR